MAPYSSPRSAACFAGLALLALSGRAFGQDEIVHVRVGNVTYERVGNISIPEPWTIGEDDVYYKWPWVHSYCLPCERGKVVGSCFTGQCYHWRGPTKCRMLHCMCTTGFCAIEGASPGLEICAPQTCVKGPRPLPFKPGRSLLFYQWLTDGLAFPQRISDPTDPRLVEWIKAAVIPNTVIVAFFALSAIAIVFTHMACAESPQTVIEEMDEEVGSHEEARPHGLFVLTVIIAGLCAWTTLKRDANWSSTIAEVNNLTGQAYVNSLEIVRLSEKVQQTCLNLSQSLHEIARECGGNPAMSTIAPMAVNMSAGPLVQVDEMTSMVQKVPEMIKKGGDLINEYEYVGFLVPLLPMALVVTIIFVTQSSAAIATRCDCFSFVLCLDRVMRASAVLYFLFAVLTAAFCLASMTLATFLSSFCLQVDSNVLSMVESFSEKQKNSDVYALAAFYIEGTGRMNRANDLIRNILHEIGVVQDMYKQFGAALDAGKVACTPFADIDINGMVEGAKGIIMAIKVLLQPANLYPFYDKIMRTSVCGNIVASLANFPFFTLVIAFVVHPVCIFLTHQYLIQWVKWRHSKGQMRELDVEDAHASDDSDVDGAFWHKE